jgi:hypothetical protein
LITVILLDEGNKKKGREERDRNITCRLPKTSSMPRTKEICGLGGLSYVKKLTSKAVHSTDTMGFLYFKDELDSKFPRRIFLFVSI